MLRTLIVALVAYTCGQATASSASPLAGTWVEVNGPGMARIAPCSTDASLICATGLNRRAAGAPAETGLVLTEIRPAGTARWRGTYHDGGRKLPATLRLLNPRQVEMKVCLLMICQTATYSRVG